ncbi:hypothetical protein PHYSODRAFT_303786 [Phytophthora sojae]|uniref:PiggyBac transposable element-derived protein domain-containing protein n=1 Tax=Phytophthora sojae (strain P6497) TaxID=1094619 RepID=G4ZY42_PHYSP|nr:hypothetical protein PHYSODRAFT_303786 [Phytophthora sojae]EGZ11948.1 hypothetical protein PHYSODRAFT_303786 [Phytophthora sojae]|eukprot:XP_009532281.1 hypothetical protein PHYSODRAFT_303786 [Phytophthora sojae]
MPLASQWFSFEIDRLSTSEFAHVGAHAEAAKARSQTDDRSGFAPSRQSAKSCKKAKSTPVTPRTADVASTTIAAGDSRHGLASAEALLSPGASTSAYITGERSTADRSERACSAARNLFEHREPVDQSDQTALHASSDASSTHSTCSSGAPTTVAPLSSDNDGPEAENETESEYFEGGTIEIECDDSCETESDDEVDEADDLLYQMSQNKESVRAMKENGWDYDVSPDPTSSHEYSGLYNGSYGPTRAVLEKAKSPLDLFLFFMPPKLWEVTAQESNR